MDWRPRCCGKGHLSVRSERCWAITIPRRRRFMRRSISQHCVRWLCLGREVRDEHAASNGPEVSKHAAESWVSAAGDRQGIMRLRNVHGAPPCILYYPGVGTGLGTATGEGPTVTVGATTELCPRIC